jgi:hypothetical protein
MKIHTVSHYELCIDASSESLLPVQLKPWVAVKIS